MSLKLDEGTPDETNLIIGGKTDVVNEDGHISTKLSEIFDGVKWVAGNLTLPLGLYYSCIEQISQVNQWLSFCNQNFIVSFLIRTKSSLLVVILLTGLPLVKFGFTVG